MDEKTERGKGRKERDAKDYLSLSHHATCNEAGTNLSKTSNLKNYRYSRSAIFYIKNSTIFAISLTWILLQILN